MDHNENNNNNNNNNGNNGKGGDDPYIALEDVDGTGSNSALNFAMAASEACLTALGNPKTSGTGSYQRILNVLEGSAGGGNGSNGNSQDQDNSTNGRIPYVSKMGTDIKGNDVLYNLWKDSKVRSNYGYCPTISVFCFS